MAGRMGRRMALAALAVCGVAAASARTVAFWRLDALAEGVDLRDAMSAAGALEVCGEAPEPSFRRPVAVVPAWEGLPAETRGGRRNGGSVLFSGRQVSLRAPGAGRWLGLDGRFTVEGWIRESRRPAAGESWPVAGAAGGAARWALSLCGDGGRTRFHLSAGTQRGDAALDRFFEASESTGDFGWAHVALVYDAARGGAGTWELFVNGASRGTVENPVRPGVAFGCEDFLLGGAADGRCAFKGQFDLWRISDEALPPARQLCQAGVRTLAWWPLDLAPGGGTDLSDASGGGCPLRPGRGGGLSAEAPGAVLPVAGAARAANAGCVRLEGGVGVRSVLVARGLGARCDLTNSFTAEGWVRKAGNPSDRFWQVVGARDGSNGWALSLRANKGRTQYHLQVSNVGVGGKLQFESFFVNTDVTDCGAWQHVALVYDHLRHGVGVWELFLDGVSHGLVDNPAAPDASHGWPDLALGGRESFSNSLEGWLDGWRVSDGPLAPEQLLCNEPDRKAAAPPCPPPDPRDIANGLPIAGGIACDQPRVGVLRDGSWVCVMTTGGGGNASGPGRHVVSTVSRDQGKTWSAAVDIEPSEGPEAAWATCFVTPFDRVYAFYTYNGDRVTTLPGQTNRVEAAWHGWYVFKYSDDGGLSWSAERTRIPVRVTAADRLNPWQGGQCHFRGVGKPVAAEGTVYLSFTKFGAWFASEGEGWVAASDNLLAERNPARIRFRLLPEGEAGIRNPSFGPVQEEHSLVALKGSELLCAYCAGGVPAQSVSRDGGQTWSQPERMAYGAGGRDMKTDRACPKLFRTRGGDYLLCSHAHGEPGGGGGNPVFVTGGKLGDDGLIRWSEPELLLYGRNPADSVGSLDLIEQDGRFWIAETQNGTIRVHEASRALLDGLWRQGSAREVCRDGLAADFAHPGVGQRTFELAETFGDLDSGGLTVEMWLEIDNVAVRQTLLSTLTGRRGVRVATTSLRREPTLQIELVDGDREAVWQADAGVLKNDRLHHVVFICDTRAKAVSVVVDGAFCDGGEKRPFGWGPLPAGLNHMAAAGHATVSDSVRRARLYDRALRTSEAVANFRAGPGAESVKP